MDICFSKTSKMVYFTIKKSSRIISSKKSIKSVVIPDKKNKNNNPITSMHVMLCYERHQNFILKRKKRLQRKM
jgi:hypothetical protein